jgi:hypothetical protein
MVIGASTSASPTRRLNRSGAFIHFRKIQLYCVHSIHSLRETPMDSRTVLVERADVRDMDSKTVGTVNWK